MLSPLSDWCGVGIKGRNLFLCNYPYIRLSRNASWEIIYFHSREIIYFHVSFFWIIFVNQFCSIIFYGKSLAHELWNSCQLCSIHLFARQFVCLGLIPKVTVNGKATTVMDRRSHRALLYKTEKMTLSGFVFVVQQFKCSNKYLRY